MFDTFNTKDLAGRSANSLYTRRRLLATAAGFAAVSMLPASGALANVKSLAKHRVLIVGAGVGGATAARYLKMWQPDADVTIIERNPVFIRHYGSSEHLTGAVSMADLTVSYEGLRAHGVKIVQGVAQALDPVRKEVAATVNGSVQKFGYDSLIVSPGVELLYDKIEGYSAQLANSTIPSGWIAGVQTEILRRQLLAMPDGGTVVLVAPPNPYRCPPGPYERSALMTEWLGHYKPRSRVVIVDPKNDFVTDETMILGWNHLYGFRPPQPYYDKLEKFMVEPKADCRLEWIRQEDGGKPLSIDPATRTVTAEGGKIKADVLNIVPPMRAANVARAFGLTSSRQKFPTYMCWATPQLQTPCPSPDIRPTRRQRSAYVLSSARSRRPAFRNRRGPTPVMRLRATTGGFSWPTRSESSTARSLAPTQGRAIRISAPRVKNAWWPHAT